MFVYSGVWVLSLMIMGVVPLDLAVLLSYSHSQELPERSSFFNLLDCELLHLKKKATSEIHETHNRSHQLPAVIGACTQGTHTTTFMASGCVLSPDQAQTSSSFTCFSAREEHNITQPSRPAPQCSGLSSPLLCAWRIRRCTRGCVCCQQDGGTHPP